MRSDKGGRLWGMGRKRGNEGATEERIRQGWRNRWREERGREGKDKDRGKGAKKRKCVRGKEKKERNEGRWVEKWRERKTKKMR